LKQENVEHSLHRKIEILREKLHKQEDISNGDALRISNELDLLILEVMKNSKAKY
jgi:hypothetical protein